MSPRISAWWTRRSIIAAAKQAGFSLGEVGVLLTSIDEGAPAHEQLRALADRKLPEVDALIARAQAMREWLTTASGCGCDSLESCALFVAGLDKAEHPLTSLLRESHNATCVVRDLDGTLQLLWQESSISDRWSRGPLSRENLIDDGTLQERLGDDPDWLAGAGISLSSTELRGLLAGLPNADGPVVSH